MSSVHLTTGSEKPVKVEGRLLLYSMKYCPFAHRVRLVLLAKQIPHDVVNVNLINKPEWILSVHPEGKVPALDTGSEIIVESSNIIDYLEKNYPDPPLYPAEPENRKEDDQLIEKMGPLTGVFFKIMFASVSEHSAEEWLKEFCPHLDVFEKALEKRNSKFFGGDKPAMVDYMLWPWAERAPSVGIALGQRLPLTDQQFTLLRAWRKEMRSLPIVDSIYNPPDKFYKTVLFKTQGATPDYDNV